MSRIVFVHNGQERFVCDDLRLLSESHTISDWYQPKRAFNPARLYREIASHDLVFCWFASWHSLWPVLIARQMGKPAIVVVGGYDVANLPQAGYGSQRSGLRRIMPRIVSRTVIRNATHIVAFSESARQEAICNAHTEPDRIRVIYPFITPTSVMRDFDKRERLALTVGGVDNGNLIRKGLLPFVQAAAYLPDVHFVVAGRWRDSGVGVLRHYASANVVLSGFLPDTELDMLYLQASVYVQASLHEGFGLSVAEAMMHGCIPVVTRIGSLPEVVGDCGLYIEFAAPELIADGIRRALAAPSALRESARARILSEFPEERRRVLLNQLIAETLL